MNANLFSVVKNLSKTFLIVLFSLSQIQAQTESPGAGVCEDEDCSPAIFTVKMPQTPNPTGVASSQRTEEFKSAYLSFKKIKSSYAQKPGWKAKYEASQLSGKSCLRYYQVESALAHEYELNPDFKNYIDQMESNVTTFQKNGFKSSRYGMNLSKRMEDHCPKEIKKMNDQNSPSLKDLPAVYMKLGQVQGYFDKDGKLIKPMEIPVSIPEAEGKMSKKEQIVQLKDQVAKLPVGPAMSAKLNGITSAMDAAKPKVGALSNALGAIKPRITGLLAKPAGLLSKLGKLKNIFGALKGFKPKIPNPGLGSKLADLFKRGEALTKRVKDAADRSNKLKDTFDKLTQKANDVKTEIGERTTKIGKLKDALSNLQKTKADLTAKLEDRPKKILDELKELVKKTVEDSEDLSEKAKKEETLKDKLLDKLDKLIKDKDGVKDKLEKVEQLIEDLTKEQDDLEKETKDASEEVEEIKKQEAEQEAKEKAIKELKEELEALQKEEQWEEELTLCEDELKSLLEKINPLGGVQEKVKKKLSGLAALPSKIMAKLGDLKLFQNKLKLGKNGIPVIGKTLKKVDELLAKGTAIGSTVEALTGKKTKLQEKIEGFSGRLDKIKGDYEAKVANVEGLKKELLAIVAEKSGLKGRLDESLDEVKQMETKVKGFIEKYNLFDEKSKCISKEDLEKKIEELKTEQENTEPELEELEEELVKAEEEGEVLEQETTEVEKEIDEEIKNVETLKEEEKAIKEEFGKEIALEPVSAEEWSESFEVKRPYWDAVFHPDEEVVKGYKGRYFEVRLKDADKNVKLLFGPGQYFMDKSAFRDNYGSTIGAFVTEALHSMKKTDQSKIQLFVQGSADIVGQKTFRGKLDKRFLYNQVTVLPQNSGQEGFSGTPTSKSIPESSFRNTDLPDLRGNFLKEMISIYSKKLTPVLLEGEVKEVASEGERNAVIYLFIPDELIVE